MAVDEPGDGGAAAAVDLVDVAVECRKVAHPPHALDPPLRAEDVGVFDHLDLSERAAPERRVAAGGRGELGKVANEQAGQSQPRR